MQEAILQRELDMATKELAEKRLLLEKAAARQNTGPDIPLVPYTGWVVATVACAMETRHDEGEIFHVSVPALYTDDPYQAIDILESDAEGTPTKWEPEQECADADQLPLPQGDLGGRGSDAAARQRVLSHPH